MLDSKSADLERIREAKSGLRLAVLARRARRTGPERERIAGQLAKVSLPAVATVAAYASVGSEPGTLGLLDRLRSAGVRVLLPVLDGPLLDWAEFAGPLLPAEFGLVEPPGPRLGPTALAEADLVLVPALAVDSRGGRLGRGRGYYDRALAALPPAVRTLAVVHEDEVVADVPLEPHDVRVHGALTPAGVRPG